MKKRLDTSSIMQHIQQTLLIAIAALLKHEWVVRITEGSLSDDHPDENVHVLTLRLTIHLGLRTQPIAVPEESQERRPEPSEHSHSAESHTDNK